MLSMSYAFTLFILKSLQVCFFLSIYFMQTMSLTKVDIVISSSFTVHLIDEEAGNRFKQQAEDSHSCSETLYSLKRCVRIPDPKMDDVSQYRYSHSREEL